MTVPIGSSIVTEGAVDTAALTFTSANWNIPQTATVTGSDDKVADPDAGYSIEFGESVSADKTYVGLTAARINLTNTDDDEVVQFEIGYVQSCVRFVDGRVKCWGGRSLVRRAGLRGHEHARR